MKMKLKLTDAKIFELLGDKVLSYYNSTDDDYGLESPNASDGDIDNAMDTIEISDSEAEDSNASKNDISFTISL